MHVVMLESGNADVHVMFLDHRRYIFFITDLTAIRVQNSPNWLVVRSELSRYLLHLLHPVSVIFSGISISLYQITMSSKMKHKKT